MMSTIPSIAIAIPTLNQADTIEFTLHSLLSQNYPRLRLIVLDGGSSDATLSILRRYQHHFSYWRSSPDDGPWPSIQEALSHVADGWFNWLNSDDLLLPDSLSLLAELIQRFPRHRWISGARLDVDASGRPMRSVCPWLWDPSQIVFGEPFLPQDATFFSVPFLKEIAPLVPRDFRLIFDTVLHRIAWHVQPPLLTNAVFSAMRWHGKQLTSSANNCRRQKEYSRARLMFPQYKLSWSRRLLRRLCKTRYSGEFSAMIEVLLARGYFGADNIQACIYWPWQLEMKSCSVAEAYSSYRY